MGSPTLIRGYDTDSFNGTECFTIVANGGCPVFDRLVGSRIGVINAEFRIPLFGTPALGIFKTSFLPIEVAPFFDAGVAWTSDSTPKFVWAGNTNDRVPVFSTGITARYNLLGYLVFKVWELLQDHAGLLDEADGPATLVHGDYKAQNLLLRQRKSGDWETAAVLDWEFASAGTPLFDLSILLRYADTLPPAFEQEVAAGYRGAGGGLPHEWKRVIKLLDLLNLCEFLCGQSPQETMIADVTKLIQATVDGWGSCYSY